ncbi:MAG: hypothetical protein FWD71_14100, partial [Oscillospiraceae bacterium]|nr:hypothetical protein [Oscillospiraceae bacterium]
AENDDEYCIIQIPWEIMCAYFNGESDYLPKLIPRTKCRRFRKERAISRETREKTSVRRY